MKFLVVFVVALTIIDSIAAQRGSYAGSRPIKGAEKGPYPDNNGIANRFSDSSNSVQPAPLPIDANGNYDLVNRISQLPAEKQPFWYINYQNIEAHRNQPQQLGGSSVLANRGSFQGRRR
jgi:hypothetical protein